MRTPKTLNKPKTATNKDNSWFVYLLQCKNGRIYTGITTDLAARFEKHRSGRGAHYTKINPPSHMIAAKLCADRSTASRLEYQIKQLTPDKKKALAAQWPTIKNLPASGK